MRRWIGRSLRRKLSVMMLVSSLAPLLSLGAFTYLVASRMTEEKLTQSGISTLLQVESQLRFVLDDVENLSIFLIGQADLQRYLADPDVHERLRAGITGWMTNLVSSKSYIFDITLYSAKIAPPLSTAAVYETRPGDLIDLAAVHEKTWTRPYAVRDYTGTRRVMTFVRPFRSIYTYETLGWLTISLDEREIVRHLTNHRLGDGRGRIALLDADGNVLSSPETAWLDRPFDALFPGAIRLTDGRRSGAATYGKGAGKHTLLYVRLAPTDWLLVGAVPFDVYTSQNRFIVQLTCAAVVVAVAFYAGIALFTIQRLTQPLRALARLLAKVDPESPLPLYRTDAADEIGLLVESYNKLGTHVRALKEQLIRNETRKKEADIRALQAQINPHFLYNTLSSVQWMALMSGANNIAEMVGALSDVLRFSLNKGGDYCTVAQELDHIRNYAAVQSIRYPDKFDIDISVDPSLKDKFMLKLLLQPLLENAMIHGIQKKPGKGKIAVYVERIGERMHFLVIDDGIGMTEDRLDRIRRNLCQTDDTRAAEPGYGLHNVSERLRLHYGPESRLQIESRPNAGTTVSFSIPILEGPP